MTVWSIMIAITAIAYIQIPDALHTQLKTAIMVDVQDSLVVERSFAYNQADSLLQRTRVLLDALAKTTMRDSARADSLATTAHIAHCVALEARYYRTAMMSQAAAQAAKRLHTAPNILLFKMNLHDIRLFLQEAQRYLREGR